MNARAQCRMLNEVKKNPRVSAKDFQKSLGHANILPLLSKKNIAHYWQNILWTDETKMEKRLAEVIAAKGGSTSY
uniref:Uncharacterized protein n=1 Tax=Pygocentrus nattereri TaxID=42514 RepID=A0AAR2KU26_PYGNA